MIKFGLNQNAAEKIVEAMKSGDETKIKEAWEGFGEAIAQQISEDFGRYQDTMDTNVLLARGYHQLTSDEAKFYEKLIESARKQNWQQAFTDLMTIDNGMPTTIIEDVYKDLVEEHELLKEIDFQYVKYLTKWLHNANPEQLAVWGKITDAIIKQIESSFKTEDISQNKLSAYAMIEKGMLDLGPTFLDKYIRTILKEALYCGLEKGIINGNGVDCPVGLNRDIHEGVAFSTTDGYPKKTAIKVKDFTPAAYGTLLAAFSKKENGHKRKFTTVNLVVNQTDYLTKILPAVTVLTASAEYKTNIFPFPTKVIISNFIEDGQAIIFLPKTYFLGIGGPKDGVIEASDEYKFLEDMRVYKIKQYADGRAEDNTCAQLLDISDIEPTYITVKNVENILSTDPSGGEDGEQGA